MDVNRLTGLWLIDRFESDEDVKEVEPDDIGEAGAWSLERNSREDDDGLMGDGEMSSLGSPGGILGDGEVRDCVSSAIVHGAVQAGQRPSEEDPPSQSCRCSRQNTRPQQSVLQGLTAASKQMPQSPSSH